MPLSLSPFTSIFSSASSALSSVTNVAGGLARGIGGGDFGSFTGDFGAGFGGSISRGLNEVNKTVDRLSGGIGSALNGFTAGGFEDIGTALGGLGSIGNALGGIGNAIGGLSRSAGDIGRAIRGTGVGGALGQVGDIAGAISSAAGQLNNVLSVFRGRNLPSNGELFQQRGAFVELEPGNAEDWRVRINCNFGLFGGAFGRLNDTGGVVWPYLPKISIKTSANYQAIDPVHSNYPFYAYKNSQVEAISISGEFSCETETDAEYWIQATTFFKTATKMFYGASDNVGNPPVICNLSGYGPGILNSIPVIIRSFNMELPDDVNYIKYTSGNFASTWVPVVSTISVEVLPIYNRSRLRQFSLQDYASGSMSTKGYI